jgi:hypothetical protein
MSRSFLAYLLTLGILTVSSATRQGVLKSNGNGNNPFNAEFSKIVNDTLEALHVPGVSVAVVDGDEMWAEVSGRCFDHSPPQLICHEVRRLRTKLNGNRVMELLYSQILRSHHQLSSMLEVPRRRLLQRQCRSSWTTTRSILKSTGTRQYLN